MEMIGGLAGAAGSVISGMMAAKAANRAANINWQINLMNYYQRERERTEQLQRADQLLKEQKLGGSDIRGTRTQWVPGKGWVVTAAPSVKKMMDMQDKAQQDVLTRDIPMRRKVMERNYVRGLGEEAQADALLNAFRNVQLKSDEGIASDLYQAQARGIRESMNEASSKAFTRAARTAQNSNFAPLAAALAEQSNKAYEDAALKSRMAARGMGRKDYEQQRQALAGLYNMFASRAGQVPDVAYKPASFGEGDVDAFSKMGLSAGALAAQSAGKQGGSLDYIQPNYGMANAIGGGASALASALRLGGASARRSGSGGAAGGGQPEGGVSGFGASSFDESGFIPAQYSGSQDFYLGNSTGASWGGM